MIRVPGRANRRARGSATSMPAGRVSVPGFVLDPGEDPEEGKRTVPPTLDAGFGRMPAGEHETADTIPVRHRGPREQRGASAATTDLNARRVPKRMCPPRSTTNRTGRSRSSWNSLVWTRPVRAVNPPVDAADVVAGQVDSRLRVFHPAAPELRHPHPGSTAAAGTIRIRRQAGGTPAQADEMGGGERHPRQSGCLSGRRGGVVPARRRLRGGGLDDGEG